VLEPNGLTSVRNVDLRSLYEKLPKVDTLFFDGRHVYIARGKIPKTADWLALKTHLYPGQKMIFVCPEEGFDLKEIDWACTIKDTSIQAEISMELRLFQNHKCQKHATLRWPQTKQLIIRIEFNPKNSHANHQETDSDILSTFPQDNGMCYIRLIQIPGRVELVPLCQLILPDIREILSQPKLERTLVKFFNEPFRSNPQLTELCIQIPQLYQSTIQFNAIQNAAQSIQRQFKMMDWRLPKLKNLSITTKQHVQAVQMEHLTELDKVNQAIDILFENRHLEKSQFHQICAINREPDLEIEEGQTTSQIQMLLLFLPCLATRISHGADQQMSGSA
jgi:hypothetical protein